MRKHSPQKFGGGGGSRTHTALRPADFLTQLRLSPPGTLRPVWGLDYPFTLPAFHWV